MEKEEFAKKIESLQEKFAGKVKEAVIDLSDALTFLCIYCGKNIVKKSIQKSKESKEETETYCINSYDETQSLEISISPSFLKIERKSENGFTYFYVEYIFNKDKTFTRNAKQKSYPLGKELLLNENSIGNLKKGIFYSQITESNDAMDVELFKLPNNQNGENIFYRYKAKPDHLFMYKTPTRYKNLPTITYLGMSALADILSHQFDDDFVKFEDVNFFERLKQTSLSYYKEQKK